ncbi:helix-turn-helix transcriptional regulator [Ancylobacter oerskovii]|uniref:Helix-turn-helix transcriptional regulator n=1 Tax=Ancylobacter oerskovii TaxID=459519 RepID=A0ABW4Z191_9HYPH|nr:helix-turn-helix domain-containing protein [Ancylobacter oerskovii]MBS7545103.1 helix-turn-helix domain-containing protein [Ancylobacter oerskovii]
MESNSAVAGLRKKWGLTQNELAGMLGITQRALVDIETGKTRLRHIHVLALERISLELAVERGDASLALRPVAHFAMKYAAAFPRLESAS